MGISFEEIQRLVHRGDQWDAIIGFLRKNPQFLSQRFERFGETFLHWGALNCVKVIYDLIALEQDVNAVDNQGKTALDWCIQWIYYAKEEKNASTSAVVDRIKNLKDCAEVLMNMQAVSFEGKTGFDALYLSLRMADFQLSEKLIEQHCIDRIDQKHIDAWCLGWKHCQQGQQERFMNILDSLCARVGLGRGEVLLRLLQCVCDGYIGSAQLQHVLPVLLESPEAHLCFVKWSTQKQNEKVLSIVEEALDSV